VLQVPSPEAVHGVLAGACSGRGSGAGAQQYPAAVVRKPSCTGFIPWACLCLQKTNRYPLEAGTGRPAPRLLLNCTGEPDRELGGRLRLALPRLFLLLVAKMFEQWFQFKV